jgi:hypothetical protein
VTATYHSGKSVTKKDRFGPDVSQMSKTVRGGGKIEFITNFLALVAMSIYQSA